MSNKEKEQDNFKNKIKWFFKVNLENILFILINILSICVVVLSVGIDICNNRNHCVDLESTPIDILCQVITSIISFITAILGITISLQNDDCFGISVKEFNKLRTDYHYSIVSIIVISVLLIVVNVCFYLIKFYISTIAVAVIAIIFCLLVVSDEVPLMIKKDKSLITVIKKRICTQWHKPEDYPIELKEVLKYLIVKNNLNVTYQLLKSKDNKFNTNLILKLLELHNDIARDLHKITDYQERVNKADVILKNLYDLVFYNLDLSQIMGDSFVNYSHLISNAISYLEKVDNYQEKIASMIETLIIHLDLNKLDDKKVDFSLKLIISVINSSITLNNFTYFKILQKMYSINYRKLGTNCYSSLVFALISLQLYYLCTDSQNASQELQKDIENNKDWQGKIDNTILMSWNSLFNYFVRNFDLDFNQFLRYFVISERYMDVPLYFSVQLVVLDKEYALKWYLTVLLNSYKCYKYNYEKLCIDEECKFYFKDFCKGAFNDKQEFLATEQMKKIMEFFDIDSTSQLGYFKAFGDGSKRLYDYYNDVKKKELQDRSSQAISVTNNNLGEEYRTSIEKAIKNEWGYNEEIDVTSSTKSMAVFIEKSSKAVNYKEVMLDCIVRSIFSELRNQVKPDVIKKQKDFDSEVKTVINMKPKYFSESAKYLEYYFTDSDVKKEYIDLRDKAEIFHSNIFIGSFMILENGFAFNVELVNCIVSDLTSAQLSEEVERYKREDGQYVYDGTFLSREEIERTIASQYALLSISIRYTVQSSKNSVIEISAFD